MISLHIIRNVRNAVLKFSRIRHYAITEWPHAVFVACLIAICHHGTHLLHGIDDLSYTFAARLIEGKESSQPSWGLYDHKLLDQRTLAILLDPDSQNQAPIFKGERPLDRCALAEILSEIYKKKPQVLVLLIKVAPAYDRARHGQCEAKLYETMANAYPVTQTIIQNHLLIFSGPASGTDEFDWQEAMKARRIAIGESSFFKSFRSSGNLVSEYYQGPTRVSTLASSAMQMPLKDFPDLHAFEPPWARLKSEADAARAIKAGSNNDPGFLLNYKRKIHTIYWAEEAAEFNGTPLRENRFAKIDSLQGKTVFLGDIRDRFAVPTTEGGLSGAELEALAVESTERPLSEASKGIALLLDIALGVLFGFVVSRFWNRYFDAKLTHGTPHEASIQAIAPLYVVLLIVVYLAVTYLVIRITTVQMSMLSLWLSPGPMAVGMAIDGFVTGALGAAVEKMHSNHHATEPKTFVQSLRKFFYEDLRVAMHYRLFEFPVFLMFLVRRSLWFAVVGTALWQVFAHH